MNWDTIKTYTISAGITFGFSFLTTFAAIIVAVPVENFTSATWVSIILGAAITASRTAGKAVLDKFIPVRLGGKK